LQPPLFSRFQGWNLSKYVLWVDGDFLNGPRMSSINWPIPIFALYWSDNLVIIIDIDKVGWLSFSSNVLQFVIRHKPFHCNLAFITNLSIAICHGDTLVKRKLWWENQPSFYLDILFLKNLLKDKLWLCWGPWVAFKSMFILLVNFCQISP